MVKLDHSFKFFNKSLSIFQIADEFYFFDDYKKKFHERYDKFPEQIVVTSELDRIYTTYASQEGPAWLGYSHRKEGRDHSLAKFELDFDMWATESRHIFELSLKVNKQNTSQENIDRLIEESFVSLLTQGVNDARLENYLFGIIYPKPVRKQIFDKMLVDANREKLLLLFDEMDLLTEDRTYRLNKKPGDTTGTTFQATIKALEEKNQISYFFIREYSFTDIVKALYEQQGFSSFSYSKTSSDKFTSLKKKATDAINEMMKAGKLARNPN